MRAYLLVTILFMVCCNNVIGDDVEDKTNRLNGLLEDSKKTYENVKQYVTKINNDRKVFYDQWYKIDRKRYQSFYTEQVKRRNAERGNIIKRVSRTDQVVIDRLEAKAKEETNKKLEEFKVTLSTFQQFLNDKTKEFEDKGKDIKSSWAEIEDIDAWVKNSTKELAENNDGDADVVKMEKALLLITRQIQNQQFNEEEKTRSDGNSGIKQIRTRYSGGKNYFSSTHTGNSFAAIHDHSNNIRIVGMGEFIAALNGVEFRTRHNDYTLSKPVTNDRTFNKVEDIEFTEVPPEVLLLDKVDDQVEEMRAWFKAFKDQDHTVRDYRKYFKPILCYLEGAWTTKNGDSDSIDEPFDSERHKIDAKTWFDLQEKVHFTSYSGTKSLLENLAHLPTAIMGFNSKNKPMFAQWNYRILCHPLKDDLPTSLLQVVPDPAVQEMKKWDTEKYDNSRAAKFDLEGIKLDKRRTDRPQKYSYLDSIMEEIPGKENYGQWMEAEGFENKVLSANPNAPANQALNGANFHRPYKLEKKDAMGISTAQRSYSDRLYVAMTKQDRVSGPSFKRDDKIIQSKVSYAIPLEIIYLTPLSRWNPYNITHVDDSKMAEGEGTKEVPFKHTDPRNYFRTPEKFFTGTVTGDAADTSKTGGVYVKSGNGSDVKTHASGVRIMFPDIDGIDGQIRQRYPIMPIYGEGSTVWKQLNAFEDSVNMKPINVDVKYLTVNVGTKSPGSDQTATPHTHFIELDLQDYKDLLADKDKSLIVPTSHANSHAHTMKIKANAQNKIEIVECDKNGPADEGMADRVCFDNHPILLKLN